MSAQFLKLGESDQLRSAFRKVFADACATALLQALNLIDGTEDPEAGERHGDGVCLADKTADYEESNMMLHDGLFEQYWEWRKLRRAPWKLGLLSG